jgi:hypothetical protein
VVGVGPPRCLLVNPRKGLKNQTLQRAHASKTGLGMPPRSDYVLRHGGRYDRDLVHFVEQWSSAGVMVFKQGEAEALWECALEGDKITERERDTLKCVRVAVTPPSHSPRRTR